MRGITSPSKRRIMKNVSFGAEHEFFHCGARIMSCQPVPIIHARLDWSQRLSRFGEIPA